MEHHPDRNKSEGSSERFKEISEAYQVLGDSEKRTQYDQFGHAGVGNGDFGRGFDQGSGFGDIFDAFFGGFGNTTRGKTNARRGENLQLHLTISFEEAMFGTEKDVSIARIEQCTLCKGTKSESGTSRSKCSTCNGQGQVRRSAASVFGQFVQVVTCPTCRGEGEVIEKPCKQCRGTGRQRQNRHIAVKVPAGVDTDSQIRLSGEGNIGEGNGPAGNLYIAFTINPHKLFEREGDTILYALPLNIVQASLGDTIDIPTIEGLVPLRIPPGTQTGQIFRLKNKGVAHLDNSGRGDQIVVAKVLTPAKLSERQRELLEEISQELERPSTEEPIPGIHQGRDERGWFERIFGGL
jgi:molecular chaperone DnaJ